MGRECKMDKSKNNNQGFTLAELMVSVAIIGILSAVAMPQYQKFRQKSINTEAYALLSGLQKSANAFYAEFDTYTTCLEAMGIAPTDGQRYFSYGFTSHSPANMIAETNGALGCATAGTGDREIYHRGTKLVAGQLPPSLNEVITAVGGNDTIFTALANGSDFQAFAASTYTMTVAEINLSNPFVSSAYADQELPQVPNNSEVPSNLVHILTATKDSIYIGAFSDGPYSVQME